MPIPCPCSWSQGAVSKRSPAKGTRTMRTLMRSGHLRLGFAHTTCHRGVRYHMDMPSGSCAGTRNRNRARRAAAIAHRPHRPESAKPRQGGYEPGKRYGEEPGSVSDFIDSYKYGRYIQLTPRGHNRYAYGVFRLSRAARDTKRANTVFKAYGVIT